MFRWVPLNNRNLIREKKVEGEDDYWVDKYGFVRESNDPLKQEDYLKLLKTESIMSKDFPKYFFLTLLHSFYSL
jgi:hypothetical protein